MKPTEQIVDLFSKDRFATDNGAVIAEVDDHYAKCILQLEDRHRNAMGAVMGGVYFTLADFAFAVASNWQEVGASWFPEFRDCLSGRGKRGGLEPRGILREKRKDDKLLPD